MPTLTPSVTLRITKSPRSVAPDDAVKVFDERGGTIGRAERNDWVLPDPTRQVSSRHATVRYDGGRFRLIDNSSNGVFLNGDDEPLGSSGIAELHDGDRLSIGGYELVVSFDVLEPPASMARPAAAPSAMPAAAAQGCEAGKPLDPLELLRDAQTQAGVSAPGVPIPSSAQPALSTRKEASEDRGLSIHPSAIIAAQSGASLAQRSDEAVDPLQLLDEAGVSAGPIALKPRGERSLATIAAQRDDAPMMSSHYRAPAGLELVPEDWDLHATAAIDASPALPSTPSQRANAAKPVAARAILSSSSGEACGGCTATPAPDLAAALRILLDGAGLDTSLVEKLDAARTLDLAGRLLRVAVAGVRELLLARATLKTGFHVPVTLIAPKDNNPLKFSAGGVGEVIETLLLDRGKAYVPAVEAMEQGLEDLKDHQMALMAGLRSSLDAIVVSFDPARIEEVSERRGKGGLLRNKKAACWDMYCGRFEETTRAAEERFRELFGKPFAAGYEDQARKLADTRAADCREIGNGME